MALSNAWCVLAALLCSVFFVAADTTAPPQGLLEKRSACMKKLGLNETDPEASGVPGVKLMACILKSDGTITPEGKFSDETILPYVKLIAKDEEARTIAEATIKECGTEINSVPRTDEEIVLKLTDCLGKLNIPIEQVSSSKFFQETRIICMKELGVDEKNPGASGVSSAKLMACMMKKGGSITPQGTFSAEKIIPLFKVMITDKKVLEKAISELKECERKINSEIRTEEQIALMGLTCFQAADKPLI